MNNQRGGLAIIILLLFFTTACRRHSPKHYLPLIKEIHQIECEHLKRENVVLNDSDVFEFRAKALKYILDDTDRKVLAHYEDLCSKVATMEVYMDKSEHEAYEEELMNEYAKGCN